ncbi:MAG: hypothetical protein JWQ59_2481 [Cryobacterium sp.]|nr:hypothetical protein [Cryobacterium sp.]
MRTISSESLYRIDALQNAYIGALDAKDMDGWLATFSGDEAASYICTTAESVKADFPVAMMLDDCRGRIEDRVTFITKMWAGTYQDYQTRHLLQRIACTEVGENLFEVRSNFTISYVQSHTGTAELFLTGVYLDKIQLAENGDVFLSKKVITDSPVFPHYIVYPL